MATNSAIHKAIQRAKKNAKANASYPLAVATPMYPPPPAAATVPLVRDHIPAPVGSWQRPIALLSMPIVQYQEAPDDIKKMAEHEAAITRYEYARIGMQQAWDEKLIQSRIAWDAKRAQLAEERCVQEARAAAALALRQQVHQQEVLACHAHFQAGVNGYAIYLPTNGIWTRLPYMAVTMDTFQAKLAQLSTMLGRIARSGTRERAAFGAWRARDLVHRNPQLPPSTMERGTEWAEAIGYTERWQASWDSYVKQVLVPYTTGHHFKKYVVQHWQRTQTDHKYGLDCMDKYEHKKSDPEFTQEHIWRNKYEYTKGIKPVFIKHTASELHRERVHRAMLCTHAYKMFGELKKVITMYHHTYALNGTSSYYLCQLLKRISARLPLLDWHFNHVLTSMPGCQMNIPFLDHKAERFHHSNSTFYPLILSHFPVYGDMSSLEISEIHSDYVRALHFNPHIPNLTCAFKQLSKSV